MKTPFRSTFTGCMLVACLSTACPDAGGNDGGGSDSSPDASSSIEQPDAAFVAEAPDPNRADNQTRDSDCDGLSDAEEYSTVWANNQHTDPAVADTDGDGLSDGLEAGRTSSVDARCSSVFTGDHDPARTTDPTNPDQDGDGLKDGEEDANHDGAYARGTETDPRNPDSDADGLCDGPSAVTGVCTPNDPDPNAPVSQGGRDFDHDGVPDTLDVSPNDPDADDDGLCDGPDPVNGVCLAGEDVNANGYVDGTETDPSRMDTDCDGLLDGEDRNGKQGERSRQTNPINPDTDGDGLLDGVEVGATSAGDSSCPALPGDLDTNTTTNPTSADSDGDGLPDGVEDRNHNGRVDTGELDPRNVTDGSGDPTTVNACAVQNLVPVNHHTASTPDIHVVTAARGSGSFGEITEVLAPQPVGGTVGLMGFHSGDAVAFLAIQRNPTGADAVAEEQRVRAELEGIAALGTPIITTATSWDGFATVHGSYRMEGRVGIKARANTMVQRLVPGATGLLDTHGDVVPTSAVLIKAQVVRRSDSSSVVLLALMPEERASGNAAFTLGDLTDGSALGQFADGIGTQCDTFTTQANEVVDIIWSVDNSSTMSDEQGALGATAEAMQQILDGSTLDWRVAMVTSSFYKPAGTTDTPPCTNQVCGDTLENQCRSFTRDLTRFSKWLTQGQTGWVGAGGHCKQNDEAVLRSAQVVLSNNMNAASFMPPQGTADDMHLRQGAHLVVIYLGDADDQFYGENAAATAIDAYESFFRGLNVPSLTMGAILCMDALCACGSGSSCTEVRNPPIIQGVTNRFNGVIGSIKNLSFIAPTVAAILDRAAGNISSYTLSRAAISSTVKVAMEHNSTVGACHWDDVPRSKTNGFDYDARTRAILFYGDCRPASNALGKRVAVSYRSWMDLSPEPDPPTEGCLACTKCPGMSTCNMEDCTCVCEQTLTCNPGFRWSSTACDCICDSASLSCPPTHQRDLDLCACTCRPDCGGCGDQMCQPSLCSCEPQPG